MDKLKMHSPDITQQNINKLLELFPNCKTEKQEDDGELRAGIDFDLLKQELSKTIVEGPQERYQLNWPGKKEALLTANAPIAKTLRPCRKESVDFDTTENLFIEGDNLDALKLLQETYLGKVKMIYIDPPYNTGSDLLYEDDFSKSTDQYLFSSLQKDEDGGRLVANVDSNGRFHSDWLTMISSRLKLAKNLLSDDGIIFISIDDNELWNLSKVCNETFGEENFINQVSVKMKQTSGASGGGEDKKLKKNIEYILIYVKSRSAFTKFNEIYEEEDLFESINEMRAAGKSWKYTRVITNYGVREYKKSIKDGAGEEIKIYEHNGFEFKTIRDLMTLHNLDEEASYSKYYEHIFRDTNAQSSIRTRVLDATSELGELLSIEYVPKSGRSKGKPTTLYYKGRNRDLIAWLKDICVKKDNRLVRLEKLGTYWDGFPLNNLSKEGDIKFPNGKKPIALIERFMSLIPENENMIVLDFFAGSASTAHAVLSNNLKKSVNCKFISVHLPEEIKPNSKANKEYIEYLEREGIARIVTEIAKERIRRAGKKIKEENPESSDLDIGFRVLKIDSSNMNEVHYTPDSVAKDDLFNQVEHIKTDRSSEDLLFQVMLDWGVDLSLPIRKEIIEGKAVYFVNDDDLVACFDKGIDDTLIKSLAAKKPLRVVFRDDGFISDSVKINAEQIFKQLAPATDIKVI